MTTLIATLLLTLSLFNLSYMDHNYIPTLIGISNQNYLEIPWKTQNFLLGLMFLIVSSSYLIALNAYSYRRFGILQLSLEFYTVPFNTLKTKQLFLCVITGLLFHIFSYLLFYQIHEVKSLFLPSSLISIMLTTISFFTIVIHYIIDGKQLPIL